MFTLGQGQTLQAIASVPTVVNGTVWADSRTVNSDGSIGNAFAQFNQVVLAASANVLAQPGSSNQSLLIKTMYFKNTSAAPVTVDFYAGGVDPLLNPFYSWVGQAGEALAYENGFQPLDVTGKPLTGATVASVTLAGDVVGASTATEYVGPSWSGPVNTIGDVTSTTVNNIVDFRTIPAGSLLQNYNLYGKAWGFITGASGGNTAGTVSLLFLIDQDPTNGLSEVIAAGCPPSPFECEFVMNVNVSAGPTNMSKSRFDLNNQFGYDIKHGTVSVDLDTTAITPVLAAWITVPGDIITIDGVTWELRRA